MTILCFNLHFSVGLNVDSLPWSPNFRSTVKGSPSNKKIKGQTGLNRFFMFSTFYYEKLDYLEKII